MKKSTTLGIVLMAMILIGLFIWLGYNQPPASDAAPMNSPSAPLSNPFGEIGPQNPTDSNLSSNAHLDPIIAIESPAPKPTGDDAPTSSGWLILTGRVTIKETGAPASGARVWLSQMDMRHITMNEQPIDETQADEDGRYEFRLPDHRFLMVGADYPNMAREAHFIIPEKLQPMQDWKGTGIRHVTRDIALPPAAPLSGRVEDDDGNPIAGARITAAVFKSAEPRLANNAYFKCEAESDASGAFTVANTPPHLIHLTVQADGFVESQQKVSAPMSGLVIRLSSEGASIHGLVFDLETRQPAEGAIIHLNRASAFQNLNTPFSTVADNLGDFEFSMLPGGVYRLASGQPGRHLLFQPDSKINNLTLKSGAAHPPLELWLYAGHTISGVVLDSATQAPIPDVVVAFGLSEPIETTTSDAEGRFTLTGIYSWYGRAALHPSKAGYRPKHKKDEYFIEIPLPHDQLEVNTTLEMFKAVTVAGVIQTVDGAPLPQAKAGLISTERFIGSRKRPSPVDENGMFGLEAAPFSKIRIQAEAPGYASEFTDTIDVIESDVTGIVIKLIEGARVRGVVEDQEGNAIEGAEVVASRFIGLAGEGNFETVSRSTSASDGRFELTQNPHKIVEVVAKKDGFAPSERHVLNLSENPDPEELTIKLREALRVFGHVVDADGEPVESANVTFHATDQSQFVSSAVATGKNGEFSVDGLTHGFYTVFFWHNDLGTEYIQKMEIGDQPIELAFKTIKTATMTGRVIDYATNQPISKFSVADEHNQITITHDAERPGVFLAAGLNSKFVYRFHIKAEGYLNYSSSYISPPESASEFEQTFQMGPGGTISGRCLTLDENGQAAPLESLRVVVQHEDERERTRIQPFDMLSTDADGRFQSKPLNPANYHVEFIPAAPLVETSRPARVRHGDNFDLGDVQITGGSKINGRLVWAPGDEPIPGETIILARRSMGRKVADAKTDDDGRFTFDNLTNTAYAVFCLKYETGTEVAVLPNTTHEVTLTVGKGLLKGLVLHKGRPHAAYIRMQRESQNGGHGAETNLEGKFEIANIVPGMWVVTIGDYDNDRQFTELVEIKSTEPTERTFEFPSGRLWGRVVDEQDQPVENAAVAARALEAKSAADAQFPQTQSTLSNSEGVFEFENMEAGRFSVSANHEEFGAAMLESVNVPANADSEEAVMKLRRDGGTLTSIAVAKMDSTKHPFRAGDPIPEAWCHLSNESGAPFEHGRQRGQDGRLRIDTIPPGRYSMSVSWHGYSINERTIEIKAGETLELRDELYNAGAMRFAIEEADGSAVAAARCRIEALDPQNPEAPRDGLTDGAGIWIVRGLWPGRYLVTVDLPDGRVHQTELDIIAHELTERRDRVN